MGEAEIRKSRGACSTELLLSWMGEASERDEEEEETLELSLGLPGGGRRTACRDKGKHPAADGSVDLSLGYSSSQGMEPQRSRLRKQARPVLALFPFFWYWMFGCLVLFTLQRTMVFCGMVFCEMIHINANFLFG